MKTILAQDDQGIIISGFQAIKMTHPGGLDDLVPKRGMNITSYLKFPS